MPAALGTVLALTFANAAALPLDGGSLVSTTATHPCPGPATATAATGGGTTYSAVSVTMPAECAGRELKVTLLDGTTELHGGIGTVASAGATTVDLGETYTADANLTVRAVVDGWDLPTTWSFAPPTPEGWVHPGNEDTVTTNLVWTSITNNPVQGCFSVDVSTTSTTPVVWRITLDLSEAPFNGATTGYSIQGGDSWRYEQYASTPSAGYLQIGGTDNPQAGRRTIVAGQTYEVSVCHWGLPPGVQTPSAYTSTTVQGTWTDTRACLITTVTGNGTSQFYFGWTVTLDMQSAVSRLQSAGGTFDALTHSDNHWEQAWTPAPDIGPYAYTVVSDSPANLRHSESYVFETCAVDW